ncbi:MAG: efflux RND transporter periplasmic adaptor subunit [Bacteroidia bacterium]
MKKIIVTIVVLGILALFVWTGVFLYRQSEQKPIVFETGQPLITNIIQKTIATGSIVPKKQIAIKPRVSGIVEELFVNPGDLVKTGQKIAEIKIIPNIVTLNDAETQLDKAKINYDAEKIVFDREKQLYDQKVIADAEYTQEVSKMDLAKADLQSSTNNLQLVQNGASKQSGQSSNIVYSTSEGMVLDVPVKKGSSVIESNTFNDGTTIADVADMNQLMFQGNVDESEVGKLKIGMPINIVIAAIENKTFHATLEYIAPQGTTVQGAIQFEVRATVKQEGGTFIRAGYSANAEIVLAKKDSVLALPEGLVVFKIDSTFVDVETKPQTFVRTYIKTGLSDGVNIEILHGIQLKDKIKKQEGIPFNPGTTN